MALAFAGEEDSQRAEQKEEGAAKSPVAPSGQWLWTNAGLAWAPQQLVQQAVVPAKQVSTTVHTVAPSAPVWAATSAGWNSPWSSQLVNWNGLPSTVAWGSNAWAPAWGSQAWAPYSGAYVAAPTTHAWAPTTAAVVAAPVATTAHTAWNGLGVYGYSVNTPTTAAQYVAWLKKKK